MRILILGSPGAGKGTQSKFISEKLNIPHVSTGDILRKEISLSTELGKKVREYVESGKLVPDEIIAYILLNELKNDIYKNGYILDGFPRNLNQARILEEKGIAFDKVILIDASEDEIVKRLSGRRVCKNCNAVFNVYYNKPKVDGICDYCGGKLIQRDDDKEEVVRNRFKVFYEQTMPVINYYEQKGVLIKVNGNNSLDDIKNEIFSLLGVG